MKEINRLNLEYFTQEFTPQGLKYVMQLLAQQISRTQDQYLSKAKEAEEAKSSAEVLENRLIGLREELKIVSNILSYTAGNKADFVITEEN